MMSWYRNLAPRERRTILIACAVLLPIMLYVLAIEPIASGIASSRQRAAELQATLFWMQEAAQRAKALGSTKQTIRGLDKAPYLVLDAAIRQNGLPVPARIEPYGQAGTRAQFDAIAFDRLVLMLDDLRRQQGLLVTDISVTRKEGGQVSVRLTLERLAS